MQKNIHHILSKFFFVNIAGKFNQLVYNYPIRIPERFSLVIRSLLTQEGICFTLKPDFKFLEVSFACIFANLQLGLFENEEKIAVIDSLKLVSKS